MHLFGWHTLASTLLQGVPTDAFASWDTALKAVGGGALIYMGRAQLKLRDEVVELRKELAEWSVFLIGKTGTNGLQSRVVALEEERDARLRTSARHHRGRAD